MAHRTEDEQEFVRFAIKCARFGGKVRLGGDHHAQEELSLFGLFHATADGIREILLRDGFIGFAVIGSDAGAGADQLIDQAVVRGAARNLLRKANQTLSKNGNSFHQIPRMRGRR